MSTETTADRFGLPTGQPGVGRSQGLAGLARKPAKTADPADAPLTLDLIPDPDAPAGDGADLTPAERHDLQLCERAARTHHAAFWLTGKALDAVAKRHLYRADYATFDDLLADWGVTLADSSRMRRGWRLAARLLEDVPKLTVSHVEALLPVIKLYDVEAAATLYSLLRETHPKVTAREITTFVRDLPGPDDASTPAAAIREQAEKKLTDPAPAIGAEPTVPTAAPAPSVDVQLRKAVDQRARQLADDLKRSRIPRQELAAALTEAFADPDDPQVYRALLRWMKAHSR
ncbi:hypothetical protein [Streptomyces sp. NPDC088847]|uniref:hypothetical protein n=1 Tax=Streptomyces sp. NPDC088847 TaxID=3365909 RepID=UPI00380D9C0A